ncbi:hypothetical protein FV242_23345 [Methylobacterium sp. WL64]|uniref:hypothetical protein n=1 Tax=Methylobacterium sp. WL64 TaxID=2603894 RepID=UPI0011C9363D|nr:hypothetical protein [Methylobacterium sp. WL64]TXN00061.1 hypothetical protein FV242_23345 [Methylobacterium sp. WL64]
MTVRTFVLAALAVIPMISTALADERVHLTPPLYREQARVTATVHSASEMTTTPRIVPAVDLSQPLPEVTGSLAR